MGLTTMRIYRLREPEYETDGESSRANPCGLSGESGYLPRLSCPQCGVWSSSDRIVLDAPPRALDFDHQALSPSLWRQMSQQWEATLGLRPQTLTPGAYVGVPMGECWGPITEDVIHPLPGVVWIKQGELLDDLLAQQFRGLSLARVHLVPAAEAPAEYFDDLEDDELPAAGMPAVAGHDLPEMVELVPETYAGPVASSPRDKFCEDCGRRTGGRPMPPISLDGSDFARSPGDVAMYVSERVAEWVRTRGLSNIVAVKT